MRCLFLFSPFFTEGVQEMPPQNMTRWYVYYFELRTLKEQWVPAEASSVSPFSLPKDSPQKELNCHEFPPWESYQSRKINFNHRRDWRWTP